MSACTHKYTSPITNLCSTLQVFFLKHIDRTKDALRNHAIVSFLVLFLSLQLSTTFFSWFVCWKMLNWYLRKHIERLDTFYGKMQYFIVASMWSNCMVWKDQTTWLSLPIYYEIKHFWLQVQDFKVVSFHGRNIVLIWMVLYMLEGNINW